MGVAEATAGQRPRRLQRGGAAKVMANKMAGKNKTAKKHASPTTYYAYVGNISTGGKAAAGIGTTILTEKAYKNEQKE